MIEPPDIKNTPLKSKLYLLATTLNETFAARSKNYKHKQTLFGINTLRHLLYTIHLVLGQKYSVHKQTLFAINSLQQLLCCFVNPQRGPMRSGVVH